jgi:hypothetical protein
VFKSNHKKVRNGAYPKLEESLKQWIAFVWDNKIPLTGPTIKENAKDLAKISGIQNFEASDGWLPNFRSRNDILFQKIHGESASVDKEIASNFMTVKLPQLIKDYSPSDIYNGDEFGLFWKCTLDKTMLAKGQSCKGGKKVKKELQFLYV